MASRLMCATVSSGRRPPAASAVSSSGTQDPFDEVARPLLEGEVLVGEVAGVAASPVSSSWSWGS